MDHIPGGNVALRSLLQDAPIHPEKPYLGREGQPVSGQTENFCVPSSSRIHPEDRPKSQNYQPR